MLAQAVGSECGLEVISVKGPQLLNKYIGASEKAVRELFHRAGSIGKPAVIVFDEFEALAAKRGTDSTGVTDRVVNQLLTFLDGVEDSMTKSSSDSNSNDVYVMALSSRPDLIDAALLRPGRIEKHVYVGYPSSQEREDILNVLLKDHLSNELDLKSVIAEIISDGSERLEEFTPADLKALVDSAYLQAVHETISKISATALATASPSSSPSDATAYITLTHLKSALSLTRSSISETDRDFFNKIFSKFRNLPSPKVNNDIPKLRVTLV